MKSNKLIINLVAGCLLAGSLFQACSDVTDMQREWLDRGETLYVGKLDSLKFRGGLNRVQMEGLLTYIRSAERGVITWNDQKLDFRIDEVRQGKDTARLLIDNLEEGTYRFYVQTFDEDGNQSLKEECFGYVYGDEYKMTQSPKFISDMEAYADKCIFHWNMSDVALYVKLTYENRDGEMISMTLPGDVKETEIIDWKLGGKIESLTYTIPEKNAIDTIALNPYKQEFPKDYLVDKSKFKAAPLKTDIKGNAYGGKIEGMWDGILGNGESFRYHSGDKEGVPHHLTFDIGTNTDLTRLKIDGREGYHNWNPKRFQLWGIDSLEGAETTLPSTDPGWEAEAKAKGWKLLIEEACSDPEHNSFSFDKDKVKNVRYVRYRVLEVFGPPSTGSGAYGCCQEITFWGDNM